MKVRKILLCLIFFMLLLFSLGTVSSAASLNLNSLDFDIIVNSDGSMDVTETWNIKIKETNTLFKTFDSNKSNGIKITNVTVSEVKNGEEIPFEKINKEMYHVTKGCYYGLENSKGNFEIAWGISLKNTTREYKIRYTIKNAVTTYSDCSEIYWQMIGKDFEIPIDSFTATIKLPQAVSNISNLRAWAHGPLNGNITVPSSDTVKLSLEYYEPGTYIEARIVTLEDVFLQNKNVQNKSAFERILSEEKQNVEEANRLREEKQQQIKMSNMFKNFFTIVVLYVLPIFLLVLVAYWIKKAIDYNKLLKEIPKIEPEFEIEYFRDIPNEQATPADTAFLYYFNFTYGNTTNYMHRILSATILQLAIKKYISFEVNEKDNIKINLLKQENIEKLQKTEQIVYELLQKAAKENTVTIKKLEKYIKDHGSYIFDQFNKIVDETKKIQEEYGNFSKENMKKSEKWSLKIVAYIFSVVFIIVPITVFGIILSLDEIIKAIPLIIVMSGIFITSIINVVYCSKIVSRYNSLTQQGVNEQEKIKGLKHYLDDYSMMEEKTVPDIILWEKYLIYATVFGTAEKVLKQLKVKFPQITEESYYGSNSTYMHLMYNRMFSISFINSLNSSVSRAYSGGVSTNAISHGYSYGNYSSRGGFGGGFSGGGGGGFGGRRRWRKIK